MRVWTLRASKSGLRFSRERLDISLFVGRHLFYVRRGNVCAVLGVFIRRAYRDGVARGNVRGLAFRYSDDTPWIGFQAWVEMMELNADMSNANVDDYACLDSSGRIAGYLSSKPDEEMTPSSTCLTDITSSPTKRYFSGLTAELFQRRDTVGRG